MKTILTFAFTVCMAAVVFAQNAPQMPPIAQTPGEQMPMRAGRAAAMTAKQHGPYKDSTEFDKLFKELYPIVAPKHTVHEDAETYVKRMHRSLAMQSVDTLKADSVAMTNLDSDAYRKIFYDIYRTNLTAAELKKYIEFVKTPEGKKIISVSQQLGAAPAEANNYVARTISMNLTPLRQQGLERLRKERPPMQQPGRPKLDSTGRPIMPPAMMTPPQEAPVEPAPSH